VSYDSSRGDKRSGLCSTRFEITSQPDRDGLYHYCFIIHDQYIHTYSFTNSEIESINRFLDVSGQNSIDRVAKPLNLIRLAQEGIGTFGMFARHDISFVVAAGKDHRDIRR
jgi:hypothetical protein